MAYPARVTFQYEPENSRLWAFLTLIGIKGLALIPHIIILFFLQIGVFVVMIIGIFAVLFTGKYPEGMQRFAVNVMRWQWRLQSYYFCMTAKYPPFKFEADYPAKLDIEHQQENSRLWALLTLIPVKYIILIPHFFVMFVLEIIAAFCIFVGFFAVLFTKKYPQSFEKWIVRFMNYTIRLQAYFLCMTAKYPPIGWSENS